MDLLTVAQFLQSQKDEAYVRTVINRSYYAIFLYFCDILAAQGISIPRKSVHGFLLKCFEDAVRSPPSGVDRQAIDRIGRQLKYLYQRRCDADYRPKDISFGATDGEIAIKWAQKAATDFDSLSGSATHKHFVAIANAVTPY